MSGQATSAMLPQASEERNASASERRTQCFRERATNEPSEIQAQCCRERAKNAMLPQRVASERRTKKPASKRGRFSFVCKLKLFSFSFSNNGESNVGLDFLIQLNNSRIFAQFLGILHHDALAINFETQLSQFFSNLDVAN